MAIFNDVSLLHPKLAAIVPRLHQALRAGYEAGSTQTRFEIFETFRDPVRQRDLLKKARRKRGYSRARIASDLPSISSPTSTRSRL